MVVVINGPEASAGLKFSLSNIIGVTVPKRDDTKTIENERGVKFKFDEIIKSAPASVDALILKKLKDAAAINGLKDAILPSGAGHDAAVFSNQDIPVGMIFIRNYNGSHNPEEFMDINDFLIGIKILKDFIINFK